MVDEYNKPEYNFLKDPTRWAVPEKFHVATDTGLLGNKVHDPKKIHDMINTVHVMTPDFDKRSDPMKAHLIYLMERNPKKVYYS